MARLDDLLDGRIDDGVPILVKIDVEGFELAVLKGMPKLLARPLTRVFVEVGDPLASAYGAKTQDIFDLMAGQGFKGYRARTSPVGGGVSFKPLPGPLDKFTYDVYFSREVLLPRAPAGGVGGRRGRGLTVAYGIALASAIPLRARGAVLRSARSPSLPRPGRAASTRTASFLAFVAGLDACLRGGGARPSLRQRTAPPQTVRAPDTRRHRCHHPSGWGGGGCSGDRRVKAPIVLLDELRWRRARPLVRRSEGASASFIGRSVGDM